MSSNNDEDNCNDLDLDLLTISYLLCVSYLRRSGLVGELLYKPKGWTLH